jgi:signal transduction histidine kinase
LRLTTLFGGLFLIAGALLLGVTYILVRQTLPSPPSGIAFTKQAPGLFPVPESSPFLDLGSGGEATAVQLVGLGQQQVLFNLLIESAVALGLMAIIAVLLGWLMAGRVLQPVHQITATARRLSRETLHERIGLTGPDDEMKELADTFDAMLARLDKDFESQQRFVANASHELRTPLTTQRALVDVNLADPNASPGQLRATLEKIREVTDESEHLIGSLLTLARSERGLERHVDVDLAAVTQGALDRVVPSGAARRFQLRTTLEPAAISGDPALLQRMVANLVDNATRYNVPDGWITITTGTSDGNSFLRVSNRGRQIPEAAIPTLFEPFRRLDQDRGVDSGGAGLGLSIVRAIALAHGGRAEAKPLPEGGLEVSITLPLNHGR